MLNKQKASNESKYISYKNHLNALLSKPKRVEHFGSILYFDNTSIIIKASDIIKLEQRTNSQNNFQIP